MYISNFYRVTVRNVFKNMLVTLYCEIYHPISNVNVNGKANGNSGENKSV